MSYSNHTTNYNLPLYVGTDKPTYLGDFNSAMGTIDAQMKSNADSASGADTKATTANTNIGTMSNLTTTDKATLVEAINEVDGHADTAQTTANTAGNTATQAMTKADNAMAQIANFNLTTFTNLTPTLSNGTGGTSSFTCAKNSDGSLAKIYGQIWITNLTAPTTITLSDTGLRPESAITFQGCAISERFDTNGQCSVYPLSYTLNTNGTVTIQTHGGGDTTRSYVMLFANMLFIKDFGDAPVTPPQA